MSASRRTWITLLKLGVTVAIFVALFRSGLVDWDAVSAELRALEPARFAVWSGLAVAIKITGILANAKRWQLLLRGQELRLPYRFLLGSYFIGRFFGIVTPGTLGLDGFRLYDSIRVTKAPVRCAAVIVIDKVIGLLSLSLLVAVVFPVGRELLPIEDPRRAALVLAGIAAAVIVAFAVLLAPGLTRPLARLLPAGRARRFAEHILEAATSYGDHRGVLLAATGLAAFGHLTTALMYWAVLMGLSGQAGAPVGLVLFSALLMTTATLVGPTVGGEGIREWVFVTLLAGLVPPARAFLFGHVGFWIEKALLGLPGGLVYLLRRDEYAAVLSELKAQRPPSG